MTSFLFVWLLQLEVFHAPFVYPISVISPVFREEPFFRQVRDINRRIEREEEQLERLRARLESGRLSNLTGMPRGGDGDWTDAVDYLMKPVETERLKQALDKVEARLAPSAQRNTVERIPVEKGGRKVFVDVDKIRYIEAKDDYSCIYTDQDRYLSTISLAKLEAKLTPHGFFRVHRGYIVNLDHVEDVEVISSGILQLGLKGIEGKKIPVSRRRVVSLKRALGL